MFIAVNEHDEWVMAENAIPTMQYRCPKCKEELTLIRDSEHFVDHFRHKANSTCPEGALETWDHARKKLGIFSDLKSVLGANVSMEYTLNDGQRPDVYFEVEGQGVAVEVQHSHISDADLADRTASYGNMGVAAMWMPDGIRTFLNTLAIDDRSALLNVPLWMRRIARLTDDVAYDQYSDINKRGSEVVSLKLKPEYRKAQSASGDWVMERYWPQQRCVLYDGNVRNDRDERGWKYLLWLPRPIAGQGLVPVKGKRKMVRSEVTEARGAAVDCNRTPDEHPRIDNFDKMMAGVAYGLSQPDTVESRIITPVAIVGPRNEFHEQLLQWWHDIGSTLTSDERLRLMGYK